MFLQRRQCSFGSSCSACLGGVWGGALLFCLLMGAHNFSGGWIRFVHRGFYLGILPSYRVVLIISQFYRLLCKGTAKIAILLFFFFLSWYIKEKESSVWIRDAIFICIVNLCRSAYLPRFVQTGSGCRSLRCAHRHWDLPFPLLCRLNLQGTRVWVKQGK